MPLDHRTLWSTNHVRSQLVADAISERATFAYFLVIMAFDWLQFTQIATTPTASMSAWSLFHSWATFAITLLGLVYLFHKNGGSRGRNFLLRYFPLSITVGWKFLVFSYASMWLTQVIFSQYGRVVLGWSSAITLAAINCVMFWRIGFHLQAVARAASASPQHNSQ